MRELMPIREGSSGEPTSSRGALESSLVRTDIAAVFGKRLFDGFWRRPSGPCSRYGDAKGGGDLRAPGGRPRAKAVPWHSNARRFSNGAVARPWPLRKSRRRIPARRESLFDAEEIGRTHMSGGGPPAVARPDSCPSSTRRTARTVRRRIAPPPFLPVRWSAGMGRRAGALDLGRPILGPT